jgi:phosphoserine phosphatase
LNIPLSRVYANNLLFDASGSFVGFDAAEPTSRDGGKPAVLTKLKNDHGYSPIIMIGDGVTDMQARPPADCFIGFGGIVERKAVKDGADWYIYDFQELLDIIRRN